MHPQEPSESRMLKLQSGQISIDINQLSQRPRISPGLLLFYFIFETFAFVALQIVSTHFPLTTDTMNFPTTYRFDLMCVALYVLPFRPVTSIIVLFLAGVLRCVRLSAVLLTSALVSRHNHKIQKDFSELANTSSGHRLRCSFPCKKQHPGDSAHSLRFIVFPMFLRTADFQPAAHLL